MRKRDRLGLSIPPLLLRLTLAVAFLWAGLGKMETTEFSSEQAAQLANLGVQVKAATPSPPVDQPPDGEEQDASDGQASQPSDGEAQQPSGDGEPDAAQADQDQTDAAPTSPQEQQPPDSDSRSDQAPSSAMRAFPRHVVVRAQNTQTEAPAGEEADDAEQTSAPAEANFTADDFPEGGRGMSVHNITLMVHSKASGSDGSARLLPGVLANKPWPVVLAWVAAVTELVGGAFLLVGLLTRLLSLGLAINMAVAMWLTQIGPVVLGGKAGFLGFLPPTTAANDWTTWLLQLSLMMAALSMFFLGAGPLSLDRLLFGSPRAKKEVESAEPTEPRE